MNIALKIGNKFNYSAISATFISKDGSACIIAAATRSATALSSNIPTTNNCCPTRESSHPLGRLGDNGLDNVGEPPYRCFDPVGNLLRLGVTRKVAVGAVRPHHDFGADEAFGFQEFLRGLGLLPGCEAPGIVAPFLILAAPDRRADTPPGTWRRHAWY